MPRLGGVDLRLVPLTPDHARDVVTWHYPAPYDCYDMTDADPDELLVPDLHGHAVLAEGELVGFRTFGHDGRVPGWDYDDGALDTGGGLHPGLVGRGLGRTAVAAGLALGRDRFSPPAFRVTVAAFNTRALRTVRALGFVPVGSFATPDDGRAFQVLVRDEHLAGLDEPPPT